MTSHALGGLARSRRMRLYMRADVMAAILKVWPIYSQNNPAKFQFHPDPIGNDGELGLFWERRHNSDNKKINNRISSDVRSVPDPKIETFASLGMQRKSSRSSLLSIASYVLVANFNLRLL